MTDYERTLPDGRWITLMPMTFGNTRLCISHHAGAIVYDDGW